MPGTVFDTAEIENHASATRQRADELQQAITALRAAANQLANAWTGPAASSFQTTREQWERSVVPLQESLAAMSAALGGAARAYESAEGSITKSFGG
ncbi:WXG100 family type VII secretion target [Catellatospora sp. KI3]|uniref:WXG100 family type VII secretion target n=1 Tax=Catellatospora sp. KI3 TaxID=3041620 RepID=UPI0024830D15|nr:WXG100 family type VII secretion target [Catellatospora sp. KI3]MDI1460644.1 WXG100 family type VII secretion target [Catellatospora sp. KI3]